MRRLIAFLIGGVVALLVQMIILPVKARTRLVDALAACLRQITEMEKCVALDIDDEVDLDIYSPLVSKHFERASGKAKNALSAAETFCKRSQTVSQTFVLTHAVPFCSKEPRIKGSFKGLALIYGEVRFILLQFASLIHT